MPLLDDVKQALRVTTPAFDTEIIDLISAAKTDLTASGIPAAGEIDPLIENNIDPLIKRCVITYCKAYFGYDNPDADKLIKAYDMLKMHLMLFSEYAPEAEDAI